LPPAHISSFRLCRYAELPFAVRLSPSFYAATPFSYAFITLYLLRYRCRRHAIFLRYAMPPVIALLLLMTFFAILPPELLLL